MQTNTRINRGILLGAVIATTAGLMLSGCGKKEDGKPAGKVTSIQNIGSDTMVNLAQAWAEVPQG